MKIYHLLCLLIATNYSLSQSNNDTIIFSHNSGVYLEHFTLTLSNLNSDKIYFSDNGDYPQKEYKEPLLLKKSTTIRVKNSKTNKGYTRNYLFPGRKIKLPIICLTVKPSDLYDSLKGIYVKGPNASSEPPYKGANFHKNWERASYIEFIDTNNRVGFNQKVGIKIFGQFSSMLPQKSFSIYARKKYGKGKIKFPLFPDLPFKKYKSFVLRNSGSDYCNTQFRDVMMTSLVKNFNLETQSYRSCVVYLNGNYWGIYHMREKVNEHFLKQHFKVDKDSVAILKHKYDVQHYGRLNYTKILKFIKKTNFKEDSNIIKLSKLIDIDNYLDYNISQVYFSNIDAGGNIRYWRERKEGAKWRWILYDTDFGFGLRKGNGADENTLLRFIEYSPEAWPFPSWSTLIIRKLLENDSIKEKYVQKFTYYLNTTFSKEHVTNHIKEISNNLKSEIPYHFKKWKRKPSNWESKVNYLIEFAKVRPQHLFSFLNMKFELDTFHTIKIKYNPDFGNVSFDSYRVDSGFSGSYFSSINYELLVEPNFGYEYYQEPTLENRLNNKIKLNQDTIITVTFKRKGRSNFRNKIIINEVGCSDSLSTSYLEIYNVSDSDINISNWVLKNGKLTTTINENIILRSKTYFSIFNDTTDENRQVLNSQHGLFKIKRNSIVELYSQKEEFVDSVYLDKSILKNTNKMEFVNTIIEKKWVSTNISSINKQNTKQEESKRNNYIILITFFSTIVIIVFTALFIFFRNRIKRLNNSNE